MNAGYSEIFGKWEREKLMVGKCAKFTLLSSVVCSGARILKTTVSLPADFLLHCASRLEERGQEGVTPRYLVAVPLSGPSR